MTPTTPNNNVRMETKMDGIIADLSEVKCDVKEIAKVQQANQIDYARSQVLMEQKADAAHERLDKHDTRLAEMEKNIADLTKSMAPLVVQSKVIGWLAVALGTSIIALIWGIITHTITLVR